MDNLSSLIIANPWILMLVGFAFVGVMLGLKIALVAVYSKPPADDPEGE